jgi:hypothetical protein
LLVEGQCPFSFQLQISYVLHHSRKNFIPVPVQCTLKG